MREIVDFPAPEGPTMATVFPAGTVKLTPLRMVRSGSYENTTFSKRTSPPLTDRSGASGLSFTSGATFSTSNIFSISMRAWLISRYTVPSRFSGT